MNSFGNWRSNNTEYSRRFLIICLVILGVLCGKSLSQDWKTVADGVEHAQVRREFSGKFVNINLLRLDLKKVRLDVHHAMDAAIGTEKTSSIATRHGAFAAINAGFFTLDNSVWAGEAAGVLMIDGAVLSESSNDRIAVGFSNLGKKTNVEMGHAFAAASIVLEWTDLAEQIDGINREGKAGEVILFTAGNSSPRTDFEHTELLISGCKSGCVAKIDSKSLGGNVAESDGYVLALSPEQANWFLYLTKRGINPHGMTIKVGVNNSIVVKTSPFGVFLSTDDLTNGVPQLIKYGKIDITWEQEKASKSFVEARHPRTAVAKLKDGKFLMLTADGRSEQSAGLDLYDLAKYMLELGAVDAMNLDGGGSSTMFLDGKVVNRPSDKEGERKIGDAILVTLRKPKLK